MKFLDRRAELQRLRRTFATKEAALVVVWGRRRIGKTRLLLQWVRQDHGLFWVADESVASVQRRYFSETIATRLPGFGDVEYRDWSSLFSRLAREAKSAKWRGPIVIDELPYLLGASPELPSVLQRFVDHEAKDANLVVALAGSSQRMMQGVALDGSAPLYGRAREVMKLSPLPVGYLGEALELDDPQDILRAYACWGGIPRYWELATPFRTLSKAVDTLVLDPLGALHDEPTRLLLEELPPAGVLRPLLDSIGAGVHRISEIAGRLGQPATSLARPLARLQELDLVQREIPFGEPERSGKRALYKLSDPFMRFWFSVVAPKRAFFLQAAPSARRQLFERALPQLAAQAWEELCRQAVPHLARHLGQTAFGPARRFWKGQGPEWDVVAAAVEGDGFLVGETKWLEQCPSVSDLHRIHQELVAKGTPGTNPSRLPTHYVVFVPKLPPHLPRLAKNVFLLDAAKVLAALH